ncbi:MAG: hypothetical protein IT322_07605 [Anaerolineae bacterium]|nr:hypothetical protein [Anaerolineae bacterium]
MSHEAHFFEGGSPFHQAEDEAVRAEFARLFASEEQESLRQQVGDVAYEFATRQEPSQAWTLYADKWWVAQADGTYFETRESLKLVEDADLSMLEPIRAEFNDLLGRGALSEVMQQAEQLAVDNRFLDPERADPRLFQQGPPDPFTTLRELELEVASLRSVPPQEAALEELDTQEIRVDFDL